MHVSSNEMQYVTILTIYSIYIYICQIRMRMAYWTWRSIVTVQSKKVGSRGYGSFKLSRSYFNLPKWHIQIQDSTISWHSWGAWYQSPKSTMNIQELKWSCGESDWSNSGLFHWFLFFSNDVPHQNMGGGAPFSNENDGNSNRNHRFHKMV